MKRNIPDIHDFASLKHISAHRVMDFTSNINPLGVSSRAKNAVRKNIKMLDRPCDHRARYLIHAITRAAAVKEENIVVSSDPGTLVAACARSFDISKLLVCSPYPSHYREMLKGPYDIQFVTLEEHKHFRFDIDKWQANIAGCDAAVIPYPSFIAQEPLTPDDVIKIIKITDDRKTLLIIDETLIQYVPGASMAGGFACHPRCLIMYSLGEFHALAGMPVTFGIGEEVAISGIRKCLSPTNLANLAVSAATESLRDQSYPARTQEFLTRERSFIEHGLKKIPGISFYTTGIGSFIIEFSRPPSKPLETFAQYNILIDIVSNSGSAYFPVKSHKWNARYLKTLKNIMGE